MKPRPAILAAILVLSFVGVTACAQTGKKPELSSRTAPKSSLEATTPTQWQPKHDPEGQLTVQVVPANAKIDLVSLGEQDGVLPVKVKVLEFGHNNGNPNNTQVGGINVRLARSRFITQRFELSELNREFTHVLVRHSFEPTKIQKSFKRVAQAYRMPVAYPTYIPGGYELETNEFHAGNRDKIGQQPQGMWFLVWTRGLGKEGRALGTSSITMRFSPFAPGYSGVTGNLRGRPEKFKEMSLDDHIKVKFSERRAIFLVNGQETWEILFDDVLENEAKKIIRGMKFVDYSEEP